MTHSLLIILIGGIVVYAANISLFQTGDNLTADRINELVTEINDLKIQISDLQNNTYNKTEVDNKHIMEKKGEYIFTASSWNTWVITDVKIGEPLVLALDGTHKSATNNILRFYVADGSETLDGSQSYYHALSARPSSWANGGTTTIIPNKTSVKVVAKATNNSGWEAKMFAYQ